MDNVRQSSDERGEREKKTVAFSSVVAAVFLTGMKLTVGLLTGSLGILAEAAHSGLDLVAAAITYMAVRISGRPPDTEHHYGHGKVENLSALIETLLLLATCAWIIYEAVSRLFFKDVPVEATAWAFAVMVVSIIVDFTRSRALMRAAKKHGSQALEADALHFSTDIWSSCVVIVGLVGIRLGDYLATSHPAAADWLYRADAIAALGVSAIVIYVSYRLGQRTIAVLMDRAPKGMSESLRRAMAGLPGVSEVKKVRIRQSGPSTFVDLTLGVKADTNVERAHGIAAEAENAVHQLVPRSDVMVHVEPCAPDGTGAVETIRGIAAAHGVEVHDIVVREITGRKTLEMHAEVPGDLSVDQAHELVSTVEQSLIRGIAGIHDVVVHIEPGSSESVCQPADESPAAAIQGAIDLLRREYPSIRDCHGVSITSDDRNRLGLSFHCTVSPDLSVAEAHELTTRIEAFLRGRFPELAQILIHVEPHHEA
ncbi:MAG: cation-efflux pump [Dehalococcoidia bacterium]|nr:cation-efflux pump [Dehalococcoidia bacterium]